MTHPSTHFSLSACALAVSLLVSACGGGEPTVPPDTVAPTVAITDSEAGATAAGPVTFTFTFSEDVGTSFTGEDITVTGGTAGTLAKASATSYTLVVTPMANATGTINVGVAAAKFTDLALNANTVAASEQQAYDTVVAPTGPTTAASTPTALAANVLSIYSDAYTPVADVILRPDWGQSTQVSEVTIAGNKTQKYTAFDYEGITFTPIDISAMTKLHIDVWTPDLTALDVYVLAGGAEQFVKLTPTLAGWNSFDIDLSEYTTLNKAAVKELKLVSTGGSTLYSDNIYFWKPAAVATEPATAAATPTALAANVLSIYSDAYTPVAGVVLRPDWGQSTQVSEVTIAGNKTQKYTAFNYEGITFTPIDISTMTKLHIDVWTPDLTALDVYVLAGGAEQFVKLTPTLAGWNSFDIDLSDYTTLNKAAVKELKLVSTGGSALYSDNIYFWKPAAPVSCGTTEPTCAPTTSIPSDALTIYSEASVTAGFNAFPNWGQATQYSEVTLAGNKSLKYSNLNYEGIEFTAVDVSGKGKVHFDLWSPDLTSVQIFLISPPGKENPVTQVLTTKGWNSVDIDLSKYTAPDMKGIFQIKLEAAGSGTLFVDNIYFWGTAVVAPPGSTPNPGAAPGSAGPVTIPVLTAPIFGDFAVAGDAVFAGDYLGTIDANGNLAKWDSATTNGLAKNGNIGYFQDNTLSTSAQKLEENGWVAGFGNNPPPGVPSFFRYYILTAPASTFASSYVGLYANAPNNGTVNVSSYGSIKFRLWGPAEMYQVPGFNPTLEMKLTGPKVAGCATTGSGATEIKKNFVADQKIGAASTYKLSLAGWSVVGVCGADTAGTAVASVLASLAQVVVTVPGSSFNFTNKNASGSPVTYTTGVNLGPIAFTVN